MEKEIKLKEEDIVNRNSMGDKFDLVVVRRNDVAAPFLITVFNKEDKTFFWDSKPDMEFAGVPCVDEQTVQMVLMSIFPQVQMILRQVKLQ